MKNNLNKKSLMVLGMFLLMGGHGISQNSSGDKRRADQTSESMKKDTVFDISKTLTHSALFNAFGARVLPTNPKIKFSNFEDAFYAELWTLTNVAQKDVKLVFAPLIVVRPFVRIKDKWTLGFTTTQMLQNYIDNKSMQPMLHDMYAYVSLKTSKCDIYVKAGNFSILNYSANHARDMMVTTFFTNALYLESGAYFPRAVVAGFDSNETGFALGYMENGSGFKFDGQDGWAVCLMEIKGDAMQIGGLVKTNNKRVMGNVHISGYLTRNSDFLLQFLNIGARFACHVKYGYELNNNRTKFSINAYYQSKDGVRGGDIMVRDEKIGVYAGVGAVYHSPFYENMSDGTLNENWDKMMPFVEFGLIKPLFQKTR